MSFHFWGFLLTFMLTFMLALNKVRCVEMEHEMESLRSALGHLRNVIRSQQEELEALRFTSGQNPPPPPADVAVCALVEM